MQLATEAFPFRRLCDVLLKLACVVVFIARSAVARQDESVAAAVHCAEGCQGETLHIAKGGGRLKKVVQKVVR
jgi:hypothetical protein